MTNPSIDSFAFAQYIHVDVGFLLWLWKMMMIFFQFVTPQTLECEVLCRCRLMSVSCLKKYSSRVILYLNSIAGNDPKSISQLSKIFFWNVLGTRCIMHSLWICFWLYWSHTFSSFCSYLPWYHWSNVDVPEVPKSFLWDDGTFLILCLKHIMSSLPTTHISSLRDFSHDHSANSLLFVYPIPS